MTTALAEHWVHVVREPRRTDIVPDGCRDVVLVLRNDRAPCWHWFDLADGSVEVELEADTTLHGFRILPGTRFPRADLDVELSRRVRDPSTMADLLREEARRSHDVTEALASLARGTGRVAEHARDLGIGERRLHRLIVSQTGRPPAFWLRLARVRRAARQLLTGRESMADVALDCGFSDQAHLCRETRRWFARPPGEIAVWAALREQLAAPAWS